MPPRKAKGDVYSPCEEMLGRAEVLQQRAERRRGAEALAAYEEAAGAYQEALKLAHSSPGSSPPHTIIIDCRFSLAETLQQWAETLLQHTASLPDGQLTLDIELAVASKASALFDEAVKHYFQVKETPEDPPASLRVDAAVNCGNTLSAWAELVVTRDPTSEAKTANDLLVRAESCYCAAISKEEDAMTWSNLADVLVQRGELLCKKANGNSNSTSEEGTQCFVRSQEAYSRACSLSSSEQGDDLPGLLLNWGSGALSAAGQVTDSAMAVALLDEAAVRLRESIRFERGDPAPHNALGDVLVAKSEHAQRDGNFPAASAALQAALDEGYSAALRIQATHADALVGVAEVHAQRARLAVSTGDVRGAKISWDAAVGAYALSLAKPETLGDLSQRNDVRYNLACCLCGAGRLEEAAAIVRQLVQSRNISETDVAADPDLGPLRMVFRV